ncbi:MAG: DUF6531 domain-containing protein [Candidatus Sulfotelmatobacter sp.]
MEKSRFWHPPAWKWFLLLGLLAAAAFIATWKSSPRPVTVEILPFTDSPPAWNGAYPYLTISPLDLETDHAKFESSIAAVAPTLRHDSPVNEFQVDLHTGMFVLRQTDLFLSDAVPLSLARTHRAWDCCSRAFGVGTNHPYDICPTGTRRPYTYMDLNLEDGWRVHFRRISKGTGYADAVFRHEETSSEFYRAQIAWNGEGWTLNLRDGRRALFPEAYYSKNYAQGAPTEMQDGDGHRLQLKRDRKRNLEELVSPSLRRITFKYDASDRIVEAADDKGNLRKYSYDASGHLETVGDASHILYRFEYAPLLRWNYDRYLMTAILDGKWKVLLKNTYTNGRVSEQQLADGEVFRFHYIFGETSEIDETIVALPSGKVRAFFFEHGIPSREE